MCLSSRRAKFESNLHVCGFICHNIVLSILIIMMCFHESLVICVFIDPKLSPSNILEKFSKISKNLLGPVLKSLLDEVEGLQPATLLKTDSSTGISL